MEEMLQKNEQGAPKENETPQTWRDRVRNGARYFTKNQKASRVLLLAIAIVAGSAVKLALIPRVTMGFQDYTLKNQSAVYDLNAAERRVTAQAEADGSAAPDAGIPTGGSCGGL